MSWYYEVTQPAVRGLLLHKSPVGLWCLPLNSKPLVHEEKQGAAGKINQGALLIKSTVRIELCASKYINQHILQVVLHFQMLMKGFHTQIML